jgi:hypothetical protein
MISRDAFSGTKYEPCWLVLSHASLSASEAQQNPALYKYTGQIYFHIKRVPFSRFGSYLSISDLSDLPTASSSKRPLFANDTLGREERISAATPARWRAGSIYRIRNYDSAHSLDRSIFNRNLFSRRTSSRLAMTDAGCPILN